MNPTGNSGTERYFERLTLNQRIQHIILLTSFMTLVLTGMPVRYPSSPASSVIIYLLGGFASRAFIHRVAAIILIVLTAYHIGYTFLSPRGRSELKALIPNFKDLFDAINMTLFYVGLRKKTPLFDRYNFIEKFEYLAVGWGSVVMIGTGLVLWYQNEAMIYLPKWTLDVARVIHSYEGLLAFLAIIIWHFYHVHLNPEVFPMSKIWLTGKISEHDLKEHHPLEYERITGKPAEYKSAGTESGDDNLKDSPEAGVAGDKEN